LGKTGHRAWR